MPVELASEDFRFVRRVVGLLNEGMDQSAVADALGIGLPSLRYRLMRLGFQLTQVTQLRTALTKEPVDELIAAGKILEAPTDAPEPAGAAR